MRSGLLLLAFCLFCVLPCVFANTPGYKDGVKQKKEGSEGGNGDVFFFVEETIRDHPVTVFSKSYCPYCKRAKALLSSKNIDFFAVEMDTVPNGKDIQAALKDKTGQRTVPNIFIGGKHIGGYDAISKLSEDTLNQLVADAKA